MLDIFILHVRVQLLTQEGSIRVQLVVEGCLDRFNQLILHERVEYLVLVLVRYVRSCECLDSGGVRISSCSLRIRIWRIE